MLDYSSRLLAYYKIISLADVFFSGSCDNMIKSEENQSNFSMHVGAASAASNAVATSRLLSRSPLNNNTFHGELLFTFLFHVPLVMSVGATTTHMHNFYLQF